MRRGMRLGAPWPRGRGDRETAPSERRAGGPWAARSSILACRSPGPARSLARAG